MVPPRDCLACVRYFRFLVITATIPSGSRTIIMTLRSFKELIKSTQIEGAMAKRAQTIWMGISVTK
jgi:hypothetical protein